MFERLDYKYYGGLFIQPRKIFPGCKSIISAALSYNFEWNNFDSKSAGYIARYTTANFYRILSKKLKKLGVVIKNKIAPSVSNKDFFRVFVNSKINDKLAAYVCGLGYYSKNSLIDVSGIGTKVVLGELLLAEELPASKPRVISCGDCNICVEYCPTGALSNDGRVNKEICIQHLSSELEWPDKINGKNFLDYWGVRFFGCTDCIDSCPENNYVKKINNDKLSGFIGTSFNPEKIILFNKNDYKNYFRSNQLGASWIPEAALARNALASLYNLQKKSIIKSYLENISIYGWDEEERKYLTDFIKKL